MKKLLIIFIGVGMTLVSCKTQKDSIAANASDDVYFNPAKDRKVNLPTPQQFETQKPYDPNQGKISATEADKNNPNYKDPNFNYDDYYDNAYAARVKRFQQPLYGTSYYDSYYTNSYFYNNNPTCYGNSIYNSYNMGSQYGNNMYGNGGYGNNYGGYYSPSNSYNNSFYNPYYNGYGSGMSYGIGYGYGNGMGNGYNPYGMNGNGMNGNGMNGYGNGMGNGYYNSPMHTGTGYYNSYDYNSGTYHYGPRGTHTGGNSTTTSSTPGRREIGGTRDIENSPSSSPFNEDRFTQVSIPKENMVKIVESRNPVSTNSQYQSMGGGTIIQPNEDRPTNVNEGRPIYNNGGTKGGMLNSNNNTYNGTDGNSQGNYSAPRTIQNNQNTNTTTQPEPKKKWFSGNSLGGGDNGSNNNSGTPSIGRPSGGNSSGGGNVGGSSGGDNKGGSSGSGTSRPRK